MKSHMSTFWTGWKLETVEMLKSLSSSHAPFLVHLRHSGDLSLTLRARPLLSGNRGDGVITSPWFTDQGKCEHSFLSLRIIFALDAHYFQLLANFYLHQGVNVHILCLDFLGNIF